MFKDFSQIVDALLHTPRYLNLLEPDFDLASLSTTKQEPSANSDANLISYKIKLPVAVYDVDGVLISGSQEAHFPEMLHFGNNQVLNTDFFEHDGHIHLQLKLTSGMVTPTTNASWIAIRLSSAFFNDYFNLPGTEGRLTESELGLVLHLLAGRSVRDVAAITNTAYETKRKQIKNVFQKLGVESQVQVVQRLTLFVLQYLNDTLLTRSNQNPGVSLAKELFGKDILTYETQLSNGETLPVWEWGPRYGEPCLWFHGAVGVAPFNPDDVPLLHQNGVRWITIPRHFWGQNSGSNLENLEAFSDALAEFLVTFFNGPINIGAGNTGVPWAVYFCGKYPELVKRVAFSGSSCPPVEGTNAKLLSSPQHAFIRIAQRNSAFIRQIVHIYTKGARSQGLILKGFKHFAKSSGVDSAAFDKMLKGGLTRWYELFSNHAFEAIVREMSIAMWPWHERIKNWPMPVRFIHGTEDKSSPIDLIGNLAREAEAELIRIPGAAHGINQTHFEDVLAYLRKNDLKIAYSK